MIRILTRLFGLHRDAPQTPALPRKKSSTLLRLQRDWAQTTLNFEARTELQTAKLQISNRCGLGREM